MTDVVTSTATSADGTRIAYRSEGIGPGLVVLSGVLRAAQHYRRLAQELASHFTVHLVDRRGRGDSGTGQGSYAIEREQEDLIAVLDRTGSTATFGHSFGGLVALRVARTYPLTKLAVYEPAVSVGGSLPTAWLPAFERALANDNPVAAFRIVASGLGSLGVASRLPGWLLDAVFMRMAHGAEWELTASLLPTLVREAKAAKSLDSSVETYREVQAECLLMYGTASPLFFRRGVGELASVIPHAHMLAQPGLHHNAPDEQDPAAVAGALREFLLA